MARRSPVGETTHLLNVDLEVRSRRNLAPFAEAMEELGIHVLTSTRFDNGQYFTNFEANADRRGRMVTSADKKTNLLADALDALPASARRLFATATRRTFDIGIQAGQGPNSISLAVLPATVKRVADLDAELVVTVYAATTSS